MPWCHWDGALVLHLPPHPTRQAWPQAEAGGSLHPSTYSWFPSLFSLILGSPCRSSSLAGQGTPCPLTPPGCHHPAWPWMHLEKQSEPCW